MKQKIIDAIDITADKESVRIANDLTAEEAGKLYSRIFDFMAGLPKGPASPIITISELRRSSGVISWKVNSLIQISGSVQLS